MRPLGHQIADLVRLEGPVKLLRQDLGRRALVIAALVFLQGPQGAVEGFQEECFSGAVVADHQIDWPELWPVQFDEWAEILELHGVQHPHLP